MRFKDYIFQHLKQNEAVIDIPRQTYAVGVFSNPESKDPKIKPEIMFTEEKNIKPIIVSEVAERTALCKEATEKAVPKLFAARGLEEPSKEIQKRLTNSFGYWWISTIETIYKKGKK